MVQLRNNALNAQQLLNNNHSDDEYSNKNYSESNSNISSDEMFEDNIMMDEEEAEDIVNKLLKQRKKPKRPLVYIENSIRTYQQKHLEKNSFNNNDELENSELYDERCQDAEIIDVKNDKNIKNAIEQIENLIKYEKP
ncbi:3672_t:CDS:2 [Cetraspora pellucida]|uniref:3672_t:CDS:1 n=1 Tax=Cetraspora pellucida TaxID=1433469 RepID=A0A9N9CQW0_9GLOM|nr:3672_t:CDS:2 [Cetraspora pellucida]